MVQCERSVMRWLGVEYLPWRNPCQHGGWDRFLKSYLGRDDLAVFP